ncbi:MAG: 2-amino-4-hydroxy-6-hydroxymethyldihydropteridine diphosphokinase [Lachnospiraceae bacterium]|nr:2-amino-4-hydroxy-6-hydroxymethyldihydropteridine diphosphokinase [Lachnospiraceae bacterium]
MEHNDYIDINNLVVFGHHGVLKEENSLGQKFGISARLYLDTREAGLEDDLSKSVNYAQICKEITSFFQKNTYQLIEAAAEHLTAHLLMTNDVIKRIDMTVSKPWAPIGLPLDTVSVSITRQWHKAYIALGSNMGNRAAYLKNAIDELSGIQGCKVVAVSNFMVSKPYGGVEQEDFLNACMEVDTLMMPEELLLVLHHIEDLADRKREVHWGPRTLDLDIIFYDHEIYQSRDLLIPHVDMKNREFVLKPMCEIAPYYVHPITHKSMLEMYEELQSPKSESFLNNH